jgi:hypothetical protein
MSSPVKLAIYATIREAVSADSIENLYIELQQVSRN